jgi:3-isopropylmalate dehydrogenase
MDFRIAVLPGDGIGQEIMPVCLEVLNAAQRHVGGFALRTEILPGGAAYYREHGVAMTDADYRSTGEADAILFGAMGLPDVRYPDGTEIAPHLEMRRDYGLYAGLRPVRALPNLPSPLADPRAQQIDLVILRESTEGLFFSRGKGTVEDDRIARETMVITRPTSERLFDFAFGLARQRRERRGTPGRVTCVDKSNVFVAMAFFRKIFDERAKLFPDVTADHHYVDATALDLIRRPWDFDVLVMENMFGDILSDLAGGLVGSMGLAACAEIGDEHALFQPAHGSAPDIAGRGIANPTAMILSAAMMLEWLGHRHGVAACTDAAHLIDRVLERAYAERRIRPREFGGNQSTKEIAAEIIAGIRGG